MRIVLDTNSLLVSIGRKSIYKPIFDAFLKGEVKLLISNDIINEYLEIIEKRTNSTVAFNIGELLVASPDVEKIEVNFKWSLIRSDPDDNKFVDCALNARADYLVTDDAHFNSLKAVGFPPLEVIKTYEFLNLLKNSK